MQMQMIRFARGRLKYHFTNGPADWLGLYWQNEHKSPINMVLIITMRLQLLSSSEISEQKKRKKALKDFWLLMDAKSNILRLWLLLSGLIIDVWVAPEEMEQRVAPQLQWLQHNPLITSQRVKSFPYLTGSISQAWRAVLPWNLTGGMLWPEIPSKFTLGRYATSWSSCMVPSPEI